MRRLLVRITVVVTVAVALAACGRAEPRPGEARIELLRGARAEVLHAEGGRSPAVAGQLLRSGDRVRVDAGAVLLRLAGGSSIELPDGGEVRIARRPQLVAGEALVTTTRTAVAIESADARADVLDDSVVRLTRSLAFEAGVYRGGAELRSEGRARDVPVLRRVTVPAAGIVTAPEPLPLNARDEWDRRLLPVAIELTDTLDAMSNGLSQAIRAHDDSRSAVDAALGDVRLRPGEDLLGRLAPPGDVVVGTAIAVTADAPVERVFRFRSQGAAWGLVVLDQRVSDHSRVISLLLDASGRLARAADALTLASAAPRALDGAPGVAATPKPSGTGTTSGGRTSPSATPSGSTGGTNGGDDSSTATTLPSSPVTVPDGGVLAPVIDTVSDLFGDDSDSDTGGTAFTTDTTTTTAPGLIDLSP